MKINKKIFFIVPVLAIIASLAFAGIVSAAWYPFYNSYYSNFNHGWGIGIVTRSDYWNENWDSGQGRYTQYQILISSNGGIYVDPSSPGAVYGVFAELLRSDSTYILYNSPDTHVYQGQYFWLYFPFVQDTFAKPADPNNDPSRLIWKYQWPTVQYPFTKYNWEELWYPSSTYHYYNWQ